jgi:hypothetical protein
MAFHQPSSFAATGDGALVWFARLWAELIALLRHPHGLFKKNPSDFIKLQQRNDA